MEVRKKPLLGEGRFRWGRLTDRNNTTKYHFINQLSLYPYNHNVAIEDTGE